MLRQIKNKLPQHLKIMVYRSLLESHLRYALPVWGPTLTATQINKFEKLQKKGLRYVEGVAYNAHADPLFKKYKIMKFGDLLRTEIQLLMQAAHWGSLPPRLKTLITETRATRTGLRATQEVRVARATADPPLLNVFKSVWNVLETVQRQQASREAFKWELRTMALSTYNTVCDRKDCWDCQVQAVPRENRRKLLAAQRALTPSQLEEVLNGTKTYADYGIV